MWTKACVFASAQSIRNYLNGVKLYHLLNDAEFPSLQDFQIKLTLRGLSKVLFHSPKQAAPFTPEILLEIWRDVDFFLNQLCHQFGVLLCLHFL